MSNTYTIEVEGRTLVIERYSRDRIEELKERCRSGNAVLNKAWADIVEMNHESEAWKKACDEWHLQNVKLSGYCTQLEGMGFSDCLYIVDGKKFNRCLEARPDVPGDMYGCRVCPSQKHYWEDEWLDLPSGNDTKKQAAGNGIDEANVETEPKGKTPSILDGPVKTVTTPLGDTREPKGETQPGKQHPGKTIAESGSSKPSTPKQLGLGDI